MINNNEKHVLVVEDNNLAAKMAKALFTAEGCQVDCVPSGEEAVELVKTREYNVIYMDIGLLGPMNGVDTCLMIREYESANSNISPVPIIAVSANVSEETTKEYLKAGMQEVFAKPLTKDKVSKILSFVN